jgi:hypothetical protein
LASFAQAANDEINQMNKNGERSKCSTRATFRHGRTTCHEKTAPNATADRKHRQMIGLESSMDLMSGRCGVGPMKKLSPIWSEAVESEEAEPLLIRLAQKVVIGRKTRFFCGKLLMCSHEGVGMHVCFIRRCMFQKVYQLCTMIESTA